MGNSLLTISQASDQLSISSSTLYKLLKINNEDDSLLKSVTIGKSRLIPQDSIDEFIENLKNMGGIEVE
jgi:excisionase family DNA binding protein